MKRSGDQVIARDRVVGESDHRTIGRSDHWKNPKTPAPVILSGAPRGVFPLHSEGRGVEGSRGSVELGHGIRKFSRERPDASFMKYESSGSFDSPSRSFGLAQDDRGREHQLQNTSFLALAKLHIVFQTIVATLREIFDESAYERFLQRTQAACSVESYRAFLREREAETLRKPRCC